MTAQQQDPGSVLCPRPAAAGGRQRGFTLLEVMVALTIAALGLTAVATSVSQMIHNSESMRNRTLASWIAHNQITELRLQNVFPDVAETDGAVDYANTRWVWTATIVETPVETLRRVDVAVAFAEQPEQIVRTVTGFIGEPIAINQSNAIWVDSSQAIGEDE